MAQIKTKVEKESKHTKTVRGTFCRQCRAIALTMFTFLRYYLDLFIDFLFGLYYNSRIERVPPPSDPLVLESATSLASKIRKHELTSEQIVRAFIDRIHQVNSMLNSVVDERFAEAIEEAQNIDKDIASGTVTEDDFKRKPFLGIPFTTKETTACKGLSNSFGLLSRKGSTSEFDAEVVKKLKQAGGILIAVTNIPQLNLWTETRNPVFGITNNPYNTTRTVGGSSGGEASLIAACGTPIGIGSDIGGSLRIPSFMCGIFSHKPSSDLISTHGLTFRTGEEKNTMVVAGPMTKYSDDIIPFLKVLLGENTSKLKLDQNVNIKDVKIYYVVNPKDPFVSPFRDEMYKIQLKIIKHFAEISGQPKLVDIEELKYGGKLFLYWLQKEPNANFKHDLNNREGEISIPVELFKFCLRTSEFNIAVILMLVGGLLPKLNPDLANEITETLRKKLLDILGTNGVLIYPSAPWPANYHHTALLRPWNLNLFAIWNALKFPVTQVPLGLSEDGLPLGIQVVAAPLNDHLTIAVAKELEKAFGGYVPPFVVEK